MSLLRLPNELLLHIAHLLEDEDVSFFLLINHRLSGLLQHYLFEKLATRHGDSALALCAEHGATAGVQKLLKKGSPGARMR
jgi:hypothetical protein